ARCRGGATPPSTGRPRAWVSPVRAGRAAGWSAAGQRPSGRAPPTSASAPTSAATPSTPSWRSWSRGRLPPAPRPFDLSHRDEVRLSVPVVAEEAEAVGVEREVTDAVRGVDAMRPVRFDEYIGDCRGAFGTLDGTPRHLGHWRARDVAAVEVPRPTVRRVRWVAKEVVTVVEVDFVTGCSTREGVRSEGRLCRQITDS